MTGVHTPCTVPPLLWSGRAPAPHVSCHPGHPGHSGHQHSSTAQQGFFTGPPCVLQLYLHPIKEHIFLVPFLSPWSEVADHIWYRFTVQISKIVFMKTELKCLFELYRSSSAIMFNNYPLISLQSTLFVRGHCK